MLHWAENPNDATRTLCDSYVGYVIMELNDDVTTEPLEKFLEERDACKECIKEAERTGMNKCPGHQRHWFTHWGRPGYTRKNCARCGAPNLHYRKGSNQ